MMSMAAYLGVQGEPGTTDGSAQYEMPVSSAVSGPYGSLFGGAGLAAGVAVLEAATDQPVIWATAQYLARTEHPATLKLSVALPAVGRSLTQGRVLGHVGDREVLTIIGACGTRPGTATGLWHRAPTAAAPSDCALVERNYDVATVHDSLEVRVARGMFGFTGTGEPSGDGESLLWVRMPDVELSRASLALMGDFMAAGLGNALGQVTFGTSLDNTIRFASTPTGPAAAEGWVLCQNQMHYVGNGFGNGSCLMWNSAGELLATASQSIVVREAN